MCWRFFCLAEAMLMGKPAIGTNYSGNLAFMHPGNSLLVDYELTEIASDNPIYKAGNRWAERSIEHRGSGRAWRKGARRSETELSLNAAGLRMAEQLANVTAFADGGIRPARSLAEPARPPLKVLAR
jgi:glycosyltransferase involved in cell wall biosynthesis